MFCIPCAKLILLIIEILHTFTTLLFSIKTRKCKKLRNCYTLLNFYIIMGIIKSEVGKMQVSLNWLNELVDIKDIDVNQIAHELTMSGLEVEEVEEVKPKFTNIITARIEKIDNHPNSDRLHLVTVNTGSALKTVVCGGQNIAVGQVIPYASVGSKVLDRKTGEMFELTPATIRGVESQGMLCSDDELGVADRNYQEEDGILILNRLFPNVGLGLNVEDVFRV